MTLVSLVNSLDQFDGFPQNPFVDSKRSALEVLRSSYNYRPWWPTARESFAFADFLRNGAGNLPTQSAIAPG